MACRGAVYVIKSSDGGNDKYGGYAMEPSLPSSQYPTLIVNASIMENDLVMPAASLSNNKVIYTFGSDFGNVQVHGTVFLGPVGKSSSGLKGIVQYFQNNSVVRKKGAVSITMPGGVSFRFYLTGLTIAQANPANNTHDFVLIGLRAEPPSSGS